MANPPPKPMKRIPPIQRQPAYAGEDDEGPVFSSPPPRPPKKPIIKPKEQKSLLADEQPPFESDETRTALDKKVESHGSPYGMHSGKKRRLPSDPVNVDGKRVKIPLADRAAYVAHSRLSLAAIQINNVLQCLSHAPGVDKSLVEAAYKATLKAADGPFLALGMDREFNMLMGDRRPETTDNGFQ